MADTEPHAWETGRMNSITYVGLSAQGEQAGGSAEQQELPGQLLLRGWPLRISAAPCESSG